MKKIIPLILILLYLADFAQAAPRSVVTRSSKDTRVLCAGQVGSGQREPEIAVDGLFRLFVAYIDTLTTTTHICRSLDGGFTWTDQAIAATAGVDPSLVCDSSNRCYLSTLHGPLTLIRSDDGWGSLALSTAFGGSNSDKPFLGIGPNDLLYATYAGNTFPPPTCDAAGMTSNIAFIQSSTLGTSFSAPVVLTGPGKTITGGRCTNAPFVTTKTGVIIIFMNCFTIDTAGGTNCLGSDPNFLTGNKVYLTVSTNGGTTFSTPRLMGAADGFPDYSSNSYMFPFLKGRLNFPYPVLGPDDTLYVVWSCEHSGTDIDVCFTYSADNGATFAPITIINSDAADAIHAWPTIRVSANGCVHALWLDSRSPGSLLAQTSMKWQAWRALSCDKGQTWTNERTVSSKPFFANDSYAAADNYLNVSIFISIACDAKSICYGAWADTTRFGDADIWVSRPFLRKQVTRSRVTRSLAQ